MEVRLRHHWVHFNVMNDVVRKSQVPYGKALQVSSEKRKVKGLSYQVNDQGSTGGSQGRGHGRHTANQL